MGLSFFLLCGGRRDPISRARIVPGKEGRKEPSKNGGGDGRRGRRRRREPSRKRRRSQGIVAWEDNCRLG